MSGAACVVVAAVAAGVTVPSASLDWPVSLGADSDGWVISSAVCFVCGVALSCLSVVGCSLL